ncbi:MAG: hypothetical protein AAGG99_03300 [Pseudomonadota bacterium]
MSGKNSGRRNAPKKPSALIDLKATEVSSGSGAKSPTGSDTSPKGASAPAKGETGAAAASGAAAPTGTAAALSQSKPAAARPAEAASSSAGATAGKPGSDAAKASPAKTGATASAASVAGTASSAKANASEPRGGTGGGGGRGDGSGSQSAPPPRRRGGGILSTLTHMIAALIGGAVVLLFGEQLARDMGIPLPQRTAQVPAEVTTRLAALEQAQSAPARSELPETVTSKLAVVDQQAETIASLQETINQLQAEQTKLRTAVEAAGTGSEGGAPAQLSEETAQRITKLERTIETLGQAAGEGGTGGNGLAQVAAVSGKLADLETTLQTQLSALRQSVMSDIDKRLAPAAKASEAARSGTQRVDRELAETKTEVARVSQRAEALGATSDRIDEALRAIREETGRLTSEVDAVKKDLRQQIASVARPADIKEAIGPVAEKVASLETGLESVMSREESRKQDAERVVLSLELANLKRSVERGDAYADELSAVRSVAGSDLDLSPLEPFAESGVATTGKLLAEFRRLSHDLIASNEAKPDASWMDQMLAGAKSVVRVRRTGDTAGLDPNTTEGKVARIEQALDNGELRSAAAVADELPEKAKATASDWMKSLNARASVEAAIAKIEDDLKSSLAGTPAAGGTEKKS